MKRSNIQIFILVLVLSYLGISCSRNSDIRLPEHTPALVLHGYVNAGDTFKLTLGKTFRADQWEPIEASYVDDGWMLLYEGGDFKDSLKLDPAIRQYVSSKVVAQPGKTYRIVAGAKDFATVEAIVTAPKPVNTVSIHRIKNARTDADGIPLDDIRYVFNDPATERNYYLAALYPAWPGSGFVCVYTYDPSVEKYTEGLVPFDQNSCIGNFEILFTDKSFHGKQKELTLSTRSSVLEKYVDPATGKIYKPYFRKYNIVEDHYKYFKNTNTLSLNEGVPTLTDPIIIKGNVKNGYGLFTIFTSTIDSLP